MNSEKYVGTEVGISVKKVVYFFKNCNLAFSTLKQTAMRNKFTFGLIFILSVGFLMNCSSGKRSLEKGRYHKATLEAVKQLRSNPNNKKAANVLVQSYPLAKQVALQKIQNVMSINVADKNSQAADEYIGLNKLADEIQRSPKAIQLVGAPTYYNNELNQVLPLAAEEQYTIAENLLRTNNIMDARQAYYAYLKADGYIKGYKDTSQKIQQALWVATLKVVVEKPVTPGRYQLTSDFFYDNLMSEMNKFSKNRFVKFYNYNEANSQGVEPDQFLVFDFEDFVVGRMFESKETYEAKQKNVIVGRTQVNGETKNVYGTAKANVTRYKREVLSEGLLSVRIFNSDGNRILDNNRFPGQFVWGNEWLTFTGDEKALNEEELALSKAKPLMPPHDQDLFIEFTKPIFGQTMDYIKRYYSNY